MVISFISVWNRLRSGRIFADKIKRGSNLLPLFSGMNKKGSNQKSGFLSRLLLCDNTDQLDASLLDAVNNINYLAKFQILIGS